MRLPGREREFWQAGVGDALEAVCVSGAVELAFAVDEVVIRCWVALVVQNVVGIIVVVPVVLGCVSFASQSTSGCNIPQRLGPSRYRMERFWGYKTSEMGDFKDRTTRRTRESQSVLTVHLHTGRCSENDTSWFRTRWP